MSSRERNGHRAALSRPAGSLGPFMDACARAPVPLLPPPDRRPFPPVGQEEESTDGTSTQEGFFVCAGQRTDMTAPGRSCREHFCLELCPPVSDPRSLCPADNVCYVSRRLSQISSSDCAARLVGNERPQKS